jgi:hypothetical protein
MNDGSEFYLSKNALWNRLDEEHNPTPKYTLCPNGATFGPVESGRLAGHIENLFRSLPPEASPIVDCPMILPPLIDLGKQ